MAAELWLVWERFGAVRQVMVRQGSQGFAGHVTVVRGEAGQSTVGQGSHGSAVIGKFRNGTLGLGSAVKVRFGTVDCGKVCFGELWHGSLGLLRSGLERRCESSFCAASQSRHETPTI